MTSVSARCRHGAVLSTPAMPWSPLAVHLLPCPAALWLLCPLPSHQLRTGDSSGTFRTLPCPRRRAPDHAVFPLPPPDADHALEEEHRTPSPLLSLVSHHPVAATRQCIDAVFFTPSPPCPPREMSTPPGPRTPLLLREAIRSSAPLSAPSLPHSLTHSPTPSL